MKKNVSKMERPFLKDSQSVVSIPCLRQHCKIDVYHAYRPSKVASFDYSGFFLAFVIMIRLKHLHSEILLRRQD